MNARYLAGAVYSLHTHSHTWDPKVHKATLFTQRRIGKVECVRQMKCILGYRIPPEDDDPEVDKMARGKLDYTN